MTVAWVPYHLDEYLPDLDAPLRADTQVTADLTGIGDVWERLAVLYDRVAALVAEAASGNRIPVVASGDCTTALGTVAGLQRAGKAPGVVWLDAHGDVQTPETTTSGYLGGMPLRLLVGYRPDLIAGRLGLRPVPEYRVVLVDARDLDPPEVTYLASSAIRRSQVSELSEQQLPEGELYVHLDVDVIDPADVPGLRYPAPGGPSSAQTEAALRMVLGTGRVAAVGVACTWHPGGNAAVRVSPWLSAMLTPA